ncbi:glycosyltransferase family 2 protein [Epibacterium ulvae]|uniref:glycosyltransferase family 2 protein n=1 Tax=Epibacterium ulvae TaxID=1156985 RepID=UPI001BFCCDA3|nr:glycosyltransferase family 2 protein [Epibacterium ulvae]MBT8155826.1 glycosyltransferase family 2 protein [Epibacterium ulvae]
MAPSNTPRWGTVSTIKAPARDILAFAAHHLDLGAHRVCIYLDAPCPEAFAHLKAHPKVRVIDCDAAYWKRQPKGRPQTHQVRQTYNANRAYQKQGDDLTWLTHIDADEFLWSTRPIHDVLRDLPDEALCARLSPIEALADSETHFRAAVPKGEDTDSLLKKLYPNYGLYSHRGLLSNAAGKLFVRTGMPQLRIRIHNAYVEDLKNPCQVPCEDIDLCHFHGSNWDGWLRNFKYRHTHGAYRSSLKPPRGDNNSAPNMHQTLSQVLENHGEAGLRAYYDEFCADSPQRRAELQEQGILRVRHLNISRSLQKHFPQFG